MDASSAGGREERSVESWVGSMANGLLLGADEAAEVEVPPAAPAASPTGSFIILKNSASFTLMARSKSGCCWPICARTVCSVEGFDWTRRRRSLNWGWFRSASSEEEEAEDDAALEEAQLETPSAP